MSSNKLAVNSAHAIVGIAIATLIGCVQFEHSFDEPRGQRFVKSSTPHPRRVQRSHTILRPIAWLSAK